MTKIELLKLLCICYLTAAIATPALVRAQSAAARPGGLSAEERAEIMKRLDRARVKVSDSGLFPLFEPANAPKPKVEWISISLREPPASNAVIADLRRLPRVVESISILTDSHANRDLEWLERFPYVRSICIKGNKFDSACLRHVRPCLHLDNLTLWGMKVAGKDVRLLKHLPVSHVELLDCELDGEVAKTFTDIGYSGRLVVVYRGDGSKELKYLRSNKDRLEFTGGFEPSDPVPGEAGVFVLEDARPPRRDFGHPVYSLAYSPDGSTIASGGVDGSVSLWDASTRKKRAAIKLHETNFTCAWCVGYSPDGKTVATASCGAPGNCDATVNLWDVRTRRSTATFPADYGDVHCVAYSPDGKNIASGNANGTILIRDVATGKTTGVFDGEAGDVLCVGYCGDGKTLASGHADGVVRTWNMATRQHSTTLRGHTGAIVAVAWLPDRRTLVSATRDGTITRWDISTGNETAFIRPNSEYAYISSMACSPDGRTVASGSLDGTIRFWDASIAESIGAMKADHGGVYCVAFSPDGKSVASGNGDGTIQIWGVNKRGHSALSKVDWFRPIAYHAVRSLIK